MRSRPDRLTRHLRGPRGTDPAEAAVDGRRELVIALTVIVGVATLAGGPAVWVIAGLLVAAALLGTLQVVGVLEGPSSEHGVPLESLFLPAIAALGCLGAIRLVPLGIGLVPALATTGWLLEATIRTEQEIASSAQGPTADERARILITVLVVALVAFIGIAAIVPGGIAGLEPTGAPVAPLALGNLALLAGLDAAVAGLLGYRAAMLRDASMRGALWSAVTSAVAIAVGAAAIRAMGIPRLVGPALLMFLFYLWDTLHTTPPTRRRDPRWIWETLVLVGLGAAVAFWNLRLVG